MKLTTTKRDGYIVCVFDDNLEVELTMVDVQGEYYDFSSDLQDATRTVKENLGFFMWLF